MLAKTLFQKTVKDADKFKDLTRSDGFKAAMMFAQAETIQRHPMDEERLRGIALFLETLYDIGEPDTTPTAPPMKNLVHDIPERSFRPSNPPKKV